MASMNSEAETEKNGTCASPATARANSVLPLPGGPDSSTPRGIVAPSRRYFPGSRRNSTISVTSPFTSSMPATSANVVRGPDSGRYSIARDRPNEPSTPPAPPPARRVTDTSNQTSNNVGPKPNSSCCHTGGPASGGFALTDTLVLCNLPNRLSSANVGRCVVNRVTCSAAPPCGV